MSMDNIGDVLKEKFKQHNIDLNMSREDIMQEKVNRYNESTGNLNEADGYNCDVCKNKGFIARVDENGYEVYRYCKCQKVRATLKRAERSGLGNILTENTFDKFIVTDDWQQEIKNKAQAFCADDMAKWFYIGGQVGAGKTHLCTSICGHYIKAGYEVKYMLWAEDSKRLKAIVNDPNYHNEMKVLKDVDVLYIDDFLKVKQNEVPTTADINLAFEIINHRLLDGNKITVISSEKRLDEIMEYDEATMSRIYQKAGQYKINIGKDRKKNYRLRG